MRRGRRSRESYLQAGGAAARLRQPWDGESLGAPQDRFQPKSLSPPRPQREPLPGWEQNLLHDTAAETNQVALHRPRPRMPPVLRPPWPRALEWPCMGGPAGTLSPRRTIGRGAGAWCGIGGLVAEPLARPSIGPLGDRGLPS